MTEPIHEISSRLFIIRNGVEYEEVGIDADNPPVVTMTADAEVKMRLGCNVLYEKEFDYANDHLAPYLYINGGKHKIGEYIITASSLVSDGMEQKYTLTGLDLTHKAKRSKIEQRVFYPAGMLYVDAIREQIHLSGIYSYDVDATDYRFSVDREDWEPGTDRLTIINTLLAEINYNSLYMDLQGAVRGTKVLPTEAENVTITYRGGEWSSILVPGAEIEVDAFDHPNVFYYSCDNPDFDKPLQVVSVNDSAINRFSTERQGRMPVFRTVDNVPNIAALQEHADLEVKKSVIAADEISFRTALNPIHNPFEILALHKKEYDGVIAETYWQMELGSQGVMEHRGKQVLYI